LSRPVAFQNPTVVARFVLDPVGYLRSLWLKKYHSFCGADPIRHRSASVVHANYISCQPSRTYINNTKRKNNMDNISQSEKTHQQHKENTNTATES
jgi:hypothetical protein